FFIFENGEFLFDSPAVGTYHFVFTATNVAGSNTLTVTVTVSAAPVTVPELTVSDVTDTTALATWTACDGVSAYTLQLSTNDFAAAASSSAARDVTTLLTEHFTDATGSSTAAISDFDAVTDNDGWEGSYVYVHDGSLRISSSKNTGDIESPWLTNASAGATVTLAFDSVSWTNAATTVNVTVTEDGSTYSDPISFALTETMTTYTTNFPVYGTRFRVRWAPSAANKRFFLDDVIVTSASSGGDDIEEFTVAGTSHTFTNLTPYTVYYARVKGNADWSNVEEFITEETGIAPAFSVGTAATNVVLGDTLYFDFEELLTAGNPAPTFTIVPEPDEVAGGTMTFTPSDTGTYTFTCTASNFAGTATCVLTVTVTDGDTPASDYEQWLIDNGYPENPESTIAENGHTYWENYIADNDPTSTNFLEVSFTPAADGTLSIVPFSTNRVYHLTYWTNLNSAPVTNSLNSSNLIFPTNATGFGRIRVTLSTSSP
ncbi:MAG: hypothetical protein J6Y19_00990, partial [Kiritimatiellae bacterium]|nr:hypothetical protein [Kiritimatiellia bacterium]